MDNQIELKYQALRELTQAGKVGLATDIDGTLSPMVASPEEATVSVECRAALTRLLELKLYPVIAVVTGRSALDARRLVGIAELLYIGNHGLEILKPYETEPQPLKAARPYPPLITSVLESLEYKLCHPKRETGWQDKLLFENKGVSASIHYRQCSEPEKARQEILNQLTPLVRQSGLLVSEGKMVVELRPPVATNKGTALLDLVTSYQLDSLVYIGDDLADAQAFESLKNYQKEKFLIASNPNLNAFTSLTIGVNSLELPAALAANADFLVEGVAGVEHLLNWLASQFESYPQARSA